MDQQELWINARNELVENRAYQKILEKTVGTELLPQELCDAFQSQRVLWHVVWKCIQRYFRRSLSLDTLFRWLDSGTSHPMMTQVLCALY